MTAKNLEIITLILNPVNLGALIMRHENWKALSKTRVKSIMFSSGPPAGMNRAEPWKLKDLRCLNTVKWANFETLFFFFFNSRIYIYFRKLTKISVANNTMVYIKFYEKMHMCDTFLRCFGGFYSRPSVGSWRKCPPSVRKFCIW